MTETTRVNFHCHSTCSDGSLTPEQVAERLVAGGVRYAALTDHDSTEGLEAFRQVLARRSAGFVTGLEMTVNCRGSEVHLLAYGFDPAHEELQAVLAAIRQQREVGVHALVGSLRKIGSRMRREAPSEPQPDGQIDIGDAIDLIHRAGGRAFLAHPLVIHEDRAQLDDLLGELKQQGLDGIEAIYSSYSEPARLLLLELAAKHALLVVAGTDYHGLNLPEHEVAGIDMPTTLWKEFRDVLLGPSALANSNGDGHIAGSAHALKWKSFVLRIVFPTLLAIALFMVSIFAVIIPAFEEKLLDRKREMIRELTNSAWSILAEYERDEKAGLLPREEAQRMAKSRIEFLRYGKEGKDYFWITDMHPRMIMHPYRQDLNGQDLTDFKDPRGVRLFVEFAELVRKRKQGYVAYVWQWKDDPARLVPKESYIKGFEPWGWIIGTGLYIGDVKEEIAQIAQTLINLSGGISAVLALLLLFIAQQSLRIERQRNSAQEALREWNEKYRSLVEAATEGTAMILQGKCSYANRTLLEMLGYSEPEFALLDLDDLDPDEAEGERSPLKASIQRAGQAPNGSSPSFEASLRRKDGSRVECLLTANPISLAGQEGVIMVARDLRRHAEVLGTLERGPHGLGKPADHVPVGIVRAQPGRRGALVEANQAARRILGIGADAAVGEHRLADLFEAPEEYESFQRAVLRDGMVSGRVVQLRSCDGANRFVALSATLVRDDSQAPRYLDAVVDDVTEQRKAQRETEGLIARLQSSLLFLHEPITHFVREAVSCDMNLAVTKVAALMSRRKCTAVLVRSESGENIGIVTDHDLCERVVAGGCTGSTPVFRIMSSPLVSIAGHALIYEALLLMEQKGIQHLAVTGESGEIISIIRQKELLQFHRYGSVVLTREIQRAASAEEVASTRERLPGLVRALLDCGARSRSVTRIITSVSDAVTERLIELAIEAQGTPPARFAFIALGSEGREEQTLATDQDNALIYEDISGEQAEAAQAYFQRLGTTVCEWLGQAGYVFCRGNVMARNPNWCQSLSQWKEHFEHWITKAEPQELLEFNIFFDLRCVYGARELAGELRRSVQQLMRDNAPFFLHLAQNTMLYKPPMNFFGRIVTGGASEHSRTLNIKEAMIPIVGFARLYALRYGLEETNTVDRLDKLAERQVLTASSHEEIVLAYDYLMQMRLKHQAAAIRDNAAPDNILNLRKLTHLEIGMLKQTFAQVSVIQKKISFDFLGGT